MKAYHTRCSETSVNFQLTIRPYITEDAIKTVHNNLCDNLKWCKYIKDWTISTQRMPSSGMWLRVLLARTDISEERIASIIRVERIGELRTTLLVTSNYKMLWTTSDSLIFFTLMTEAVSTSETLLLTRATRSHMQEEYILRSHRLESIKSYIPLTGLAL
jgi:hypothetical protein